MSLLDNDQDEIDYVYNSYSNDDYEEIERVVQSIDAQVIIDK